MALTKLLVLSIFIGLFIGALCHPKFGVLGYLVVYLIYNPFIWWGEALAQYFPRPSYLAMIVLIIGSVIHIRKLNWSLSREEVNFYLFLGLIWLSSFAFGIGMQENNWNYLIKMTKLFIFIFLFIRISNTLTDYELVIWTIILGVIFLSYQSHTVSSSYFHGGRLEALGGMDFGEANGIAALSAIGMIFLGAKTLRASGFKKLINIFGIALIMDTIILTQSRGVFVGLLIAALYFILCTPSKSRKQVYLFALLGIILFFSLVDLKFIFRMKTVGNQLEYSQEEELTRLDFWIASIPMFKDHPFGVGIKNFEKLVPFYDERNPGMDAHNTYVICYSEIGILGITLFLIIISKAFFQLRRIRLMVMNTKYEKSVSLEILALGGVLIVYLTGYGMTHSALYKEILWILFSMPICLENSIKKFLQHTV